MQIDYQKYPLPKRLRHHTASNLYFPVSELKLIPDYYPPLITQIDFGKLFINGKKPNVLDIGCGKCNFLLQYSELHPDDNILGIEVRSPLPKWLNDFVAGENLPNAAALWYSVVNGLHFIETETIKSIFYLFPDPWPKRKHTKRRVYSAEFLGECHRILQNNGKLHLATDLPEIHEYHVEVLNEFNSSPQNKPKQFKWKIVENESEWDLPTTNKQRFCNETKIEYFRIIAEKSELSK